MYIYIAIALLSAALSGIGAWRVQDWRYGAKEAQRLEQAREDRARRERGIDVAAVGHERDKERIRTVTKTVLQEVDRVVKETFYVAVPGPAGPVPACLDDAGLRLIADAIGPARAASQPARAVPRSEPAR